MKHLQSVAAATTAASAAGLPAPGPAEPESQDRLDIDSHDAIVKVLELAMSAAAAGKVGDLRKAFHDDARMFGEVHGKRYDAPIKEFFELCEAHPLGKGGQYRSRIVSITRAGAAAIATVTEDGCWGTASFVDFFTVTRIGGAWKITNKTFAYTGGAIPPGIED
jgi:hypothetical protein